MLTEIGKEMRKLRIDHGERLLEMAAKLGRSVSFLSAVEIGVKSPPKGLEEEVIRIYGLTEPEAHRMRKAADRSRVSFTLEPETHIAKDTAALFARKINTLTTAQLEKINSILERQSHERD